MSFQFGLENLLGDKNLLSELRKRRVGLVAHPASVDKNLNHTLDLLKNANVNLTCGFGPQHGIRGEKQDNMVESEDFVDPELKIPIFSLYGKVRRLSPEMIEKFDLLLFDLQDVGCRIYTFLTTLFYCLEDLAAHPGKEMWVLDRPNPAGRPVEGLTLKKGFESFVGAAPLPMRHGLTLGEAATWFKVHSGLPTHLKVVPMVDYSPQINPWPQNLAWVNPSPNLPRLSGVWVYPGTVLIEGVHLSEGRGTTVPLEIFGAPKLDHRKILRTMAEIEPKWLEHCVIRPTYYEPTFHKFKGELVNGLQVHVDHPKYVHDLFKPFRLISLYFKAVRMCYPEFDLWKNPPYEYVTDRLPIDVISGSEDLRHWCDNSASKSSDLEALLQRDEKSWLAKRAQYFIY